jgi:PhnB protein
MKLYAQLNFGGNCEEAFRFYEKHLGGKITMMMNQSQAPGAPSGAGKAIIHARMNIGDTVLIANDVPPSVFKKNPQRLHLSFRGFGGRGGESPQASC